MEQVEVYVRNLCLSRQTEIIDLPVRRVLSFSKLSMYIQSRPHGLTGVTHWLMWLNTPTPSLFVHCSPGGSLISFPLVSCESMPA